MREHRLKTLSPYWEAVASGEKTFEVRKDDRGFQKGDTLILEQWDGKEYVRDYSGAGKNNHWGPYYPKSVRRVVGFVLGGAQFGIEPTYVVMSLLPEPIAPAPTKPEEE